MRRLDPGRRKSGGAESNGLAMGSDWHKDAHCRFGLEGEVMCCEQIAVGMYDGKVEEIASLATIPERTHQGEEKR